MAAMRLTREMRHSMERRLEDLDARLGLLEVQREGDDSVETEALRNELMRERAHLSDALRDATIIDDEPFDFDAIEVGDVVTIRDEDGETDRYVLVDDGVGTRARSDWVSVGSPLGAAILGRGKGDRVEVASPRGPLSYVIVHFERASEEAPVSGADGRSLTQDFRTAASLG